MKCDCGGHMTYQLKSTIDAHGNDVFTNYVCVRCGARAYDEGRRTTGCGIDYCDQE